MSEQVLSVGIEWWCVMEERGNFYYCFMLKNGWQRFWTNMRESNLRRIVESDGRHVLEDVDACVHPKRRDMEEVES